MTDVCLKILLISTKNYPTQSKPLLLKSIITQPNHNSSNSTTTVATTTTTVIATYQWIYSHQKHKPTKQTKPTKPNKETIPLNSQV